MMVVLISSNDADFLGFKNLEPGAEQNQVWSTSQATPAKWDQLKRKPELSDNQRFLF